MSKIREFYVGKLAHTLVIMLAVSFVSSCKSATARYDSIPKQIVHYEDYRFNVRTIKAEGMVDVLVMADEGLRWMDEWFIERQRFLAIAKKEADAVCHGDSKLVDADKPFQNAVGIEARYSCD